MAHAPADTRSLADLPSGTRAALDQLFPLVYDELHALAHRNRRRWRGDETLGTTALIHEAYLKLVGQQQVGARSRAHFFAVAAQAMRHILCNHARDRRRLKRGGDLRRVPLDRAEEEAPWQMELSDRQAETLAALDVALEQMERTNRRLSRVVECRFFGGMTTEETAVALGTSAATVKRDWALARAWLYREMQRERDA